MEKEQPLMGWRVSVIKVARVIIGVIFKVRF